MHILYFMYYVHIYVYIYMAALDMLKHVVSSTPTFRVIQSAATESLSGMDLAVHSCSYVA